MSDGSASNTIFDRFSNAIHSLWKVVRDSLHLSAYLAIATILVYTWRRPDKVGGFVNALGLEHAEFAGLKVDFKKVATAANNASFHADEIESTLKALNTSALDSTSKEKIKKLTQTAEELTGELKTVNAPVKKAVEAQSQVQTPSQVETPLTGWMFLGRTDDAVQRWDTERETVPMPISRDNGPRFNTDDTVKVTTDAYLRADGPEFALTSHRIIGVVPEGATVRIKDLRPNPIRSGGKYLWAKVEVVQ